MGRTCLLNFPLPSTAPHEPLTALHILLPFTIPFGPEKLSMTGDVHTIRANWCLYENNYFSNLSFLRGKGQEHPAVQIFERFLPLPLPVEETKAS